MKILIYEPVHLDWLIPLTEALADSPHSVVFISNQDFKVDLTENISTEVLNKYEFVWIRTGCSVMKEYRCLSRTIKKMGPDVFWLNTASARHLLFYFLKKKFTRLRMIVNVHDVNNFFLHKQFGSIQSYFRFLGKKLLRRVTDMYIVNAYAMKQHINVKSFTSKPVYHIPPVFYKPQYISKTYAINIVVPGTVEQKRRDYLTVLNAFNSFTKANPDTNFRLTLAGRLADGTLLTHMYRNSRIKWSYKSISESEFQRMTAGASVLLSPQQLKFEGLDGLTEYYGLTKNSGNSYDAIRHAKPMIIPTELPVPEALEPFILRYKNEKHLLQIFELIAKDRSIIDKLQQAAVAACSLFTKEAMRDRIHAMIDEV